MLTVQHYMRRPHFAVRFLLAVISLLSLSIAPTVAQAKEKNIKENNVKAHKAKRHAAPKTQELAPLATQTYMTQRSTLDTSSCDESAKQVAQRFEASTHVKVTASQCNGRIEARPGGPSHPLDSITISYLNRQPVKPYAAFLAKGYGNEPFRGASGVYAQYNDCVADLTAQTQNFEKETGLAVVSSACLLAPEGELEAYGMRLEGFGTPKRRLFSYASHFADYYPNDLATWVKSFLAARSISTIRETGKGFLYYAPQAVTFGHGQFSSFNYVKTCQTQLNEAQNFFGSAGINAFLQCIATGDPDVGGAVMAAVWSGWEVLSASAPQNRDQYYSLQECSADKARVLEIEKRSGRRAIGALCRESDALNLSGNTNYVMDIVEEL